jgi:formylmethanofuran dehydrogenase subunit E
MSVMSTHEHRGALRLILIYIVALGAACGGAEGEPTHAHGTTHGDPHAHHPHAGPPTGHPAAPVDEDLARVAAIHGGAGPWAVAGYRMGQYALRKLGLSRQSFDMEIIHRSPREVQYTCIADGAAASTGASLGKLNLSIEEADKEHVQTVYRRKSTGQSIVLRPTEGFAARFKDVPREALSSKGREVMQLRDEEIFEEVR